MMDRNTLGYESPVRSSVNNLYQRKKRNKSMIQDLTKRVCQRMCIKSYTLLNSRKKKTKKKSLGDIDTRIREAARLFRQRVVACSC